MDKNLIWVAGIASLLLCMTVPLASAQTFVMEDDKIMPLGIYAMIAAIIVLAGYYSFTSEDRNSFTDIFCAFLCALLSLFLMIFTFWGVQDAEGYVWRSGWLGVIWGLAMVYFIGLFISKMMDVTSREGNKFGW